MTRTMIGRSLHLWVGLVAVLILSAQSEAASRGVRGSEVIATFFNEGHSTVQLNLISKDGRDTTILTFSPGQIERAVIHEGQIKVYTPSERLSSRQLLSTREMPTPRLAAEFFENATQTFYFRVSGKNVTLVKPRNLTVRERSRLQAYKRQVQKG